MRTVLNSPFGLRNSRAMTKLSSKLSFTHSETNRSEELPRSLLDLSEVKGLSGCRAPLLGVGNHRVRTCVQQSLNLSAAFQGLCSCAVFTPSALSGEIFELLCLMAGYIFTVKIPVLSTALFLH